MACSGGASSAQENQNLLTTVEELQQTEKRSYRQIIHSQGFSVQEAQSLIQSTTEGSTNQQPKRAPPRCSDCNNLGHKRTHCPNRRSN